MVITYTLSIILLIIAYLLGSIPSAVWIGKRYYGIDVREYGSKNAGSTNVLRVLGRRAALPVFALDIAKGFVAVTIVGLLEHDPSISDLWIANLKIATVFIAVIGHIFPIFAGFRGGKGVATLVGTVLGINPPVVLLCFAMWIIIFMIFHYVSLASMIGGSCFPLLTIISPWSEATLPYTIFSVVVAALLIWTHRKNIERLRQGTESKIYIFKQSKKDN
ncbi:MAG: glycerol-3-phosphate 1-O-acyltransferase PlsY [Rikenellaceae bacterium]